MFNEMPKEAIPTQSQEDLARDALLREIKLQNEISSAQLESKNIRKKIDDAEVILHNAKILNELSRILVKIFFNKFAFIAWIVTYMSFNASLYYLFGESARFYIALVDKVGIFIIVCVLGKFLKDNLALFVEAFRK